MLGVLAQWYRESLVENIDMGIQHAIESGRWLNRAPSGYDMVDKELVPNEIAPLVVRIFELRAEGKSYNEIEQATGVLLSTVRHICGNRAYLGLTHRKGNWFPGRHQALVSPALFEAAQRGNPTGKRIGKDLLSGRVVCGHCGRRQSIESNGRGHGIYRCKHRGKGCAIPGRSAHGLLRAAVLAMDEIGTDTSLQAAIRQYIEQSAPGAQAAPPPSAGALSTLRRKRQKLLDLYYADKISPDTFNEEETRLSRQIRTLEQDAEATEAATQQRHRLADEFEAVAAMLREMDVDAIWDAANEREKRLLISEIVDKVIVHEDRLQVAVNGAPPITIALHEVGLRETKRPPSRAAGIGFDVSEGGLEPPHSYEY